MALDDVIRSCLGLEILSLKPKAQGGTRGAADARASMHPENVPDRGDSIASRLEYVGRERRREALLDAVSSIERPS